MVSSKPRATIRSHTSRHCCRYEGTLAPLVRIICWSSGGVRVGTDAPRTDVHEFFVKFIRRTMVSDVTSCGKDRQAG